MSHAYAEIIKDGKVIGWGEYNGTSDVMLPKIRESEEEVWKHWRERDPFQYQCKCAEPKPEPVIVYSHYGCRFWWKSEACLTCRVLTGELCPDDMDDIVKRGDPLGRSDD
ncbi:MAG: hypothetical protein K2W95_00990 [Candidatus Obscuribacterales bacterium]|nr:hypothetical protein [Candidatus Obscuribacterales bacterium]